MECPAYGCHPHNNPQLLRRPPDGRSWIFSDCKECFVVRVFFFTIVLSLFDRNRVVLKRMPRIYLTDRWSKHPVSIERDLNALPDLFHQEESTVSSAEVRGRFMVVERKLLNLSPIDNHAVHNLIRDDVNAPCLPKFTSTTVKYYIRIDEREKRQT